MMKRPIRQHLSTKNLSIIGIPKRFHNVTLDDFKDYNDNDLVDLRTFVGEYIDNIDDNFANGRGIYFCGANGVGKTMLSSIIVKEAYRHRYTSKRVTFAEYVTRYTAMWGAKNPDEKEGLEEEFYNRYKAVEFLVLEEVGKELDTKAVRPILEDLLRYREDEGLVTIMCTNISPEQFKEIYGNSIFSLVRGGTTYVEIDGADRRKERK